MTGIRFEMVVEAIHPDGRRARVGSYPVPACCLMCGGPVVEGEEMRARMATVNNQAGLVCLDHGPGMGRLG